MTVKTKIATTLLTAGLIAGPVVSHAAFEMSQAERSLLLQEFSAASPKDMNHINMPNPTITLFSAKVHGLGNCEGNVGFTVTNAFTDGTLQKVWSRFTEILKGMVSKGGLIYLAGLYVERSNPNLYQLITNGIDLGIEDFLSGVASCEAMGNALMTSDAAGELIKYQKEAAYSVYTEQLIEDMWSDGKDIDVNGVINGKIKTGINEGVDWLTGKAGGSDNQPIRIVADSAQYGWCYMRGIKKEDCVSTQKTIDVDQADDSDYNQMVILTVGETLEDAIAVAQQVLGSKSIRLCDNCDTLSKEGKGAMSYLQNHKVSVYIKLKENYTKSPQLITDEDYKQMGAPGAIEVRFIHMQSFRVLSSDPEILDLYLAGVAFDVAYARTMFLLSELDVAFAQIEYNADITDAPRQQVSNYRAMIKSERERLITYYESRNYKPQQYVNRLLEVTTESGIKPR
ncbi:hypothetical protein [Vibrio mediterranei]|uniref:hypothetical protein n=1 Tax=Vibrio mediterranei TaxID=689 RepID=UPI0040679689